jgi:SAM-dependent methyltransferase
MEVKKMNDEILLTQTSPDKELATGKMPGHWLLASLGKRVLRPGGMELTHEMLETIDVQTTDKVVEFAPGLGVTAKLTLARNPASYTAVERDQAAADSVGKYLTGSNRKCLVGRAEETGLPDTSATVVYCEAMLTMQPQQKKIKIVQEAYRILQEGGRYGIHELCLRPDDLDESIKEEIEAALSNAIHVGARPLTSLEWRTLLEENGFEVQAEAEAPMHLLQPKRMFQDEGLWRTVRVAFNMLRNGQARNRVLAMRRVFKQYEHNLGAIMLVATKTKEQR